jgi:hypothetical protein
MESFVASKEQPRPERPRIEVVLNETQRNNENRLMLKVSEMDAMMRRKKKRRMNGK